jgi:hypothetical protein
MRMFDYLSDMENMDDEEIRCPATSKLIKSAFSNKGLNSLKSYYDKQDQNEVIKNDIPVVYTNYITLFRVTGGLEYHLIKLNKYKEFPCDLEDNFIFYPSVSESFAGQAARNLFPKHHFDGQISFLLKLKISKAYITTQNSRQLGGQYNLQYWIPSHGMEKFNQNIFGQIEIARKFGSWTTKGP